MSSSSLRFTLNGREIDATGADPNTTLLGWLRAEGHTGSKEGCAEGECGACAVVLVQPGLDGGTRYVPVNGCLLLLASADGQELLTVEGVAQGGLHPVQQAMVDSGGSQCGYCTPGFVMSLFAEYYREGRAERGFDVESIMGNLCRCTGYRPIRDAGRALPMVNAETDAHAQRLERPAPASRGLDYAVDARRYLRPTTLDEAIALLAEHPGATVVSGGTDLVVELNQRLRRLETILALEAVRELRVFEDGPDMLRIGAGVPLSEVEDRIGASPSMLAELLPLFSSRLIRNRATLGGNLGTASPIGDSPPVLLALDARIIAAGPDGKRTIEIADLFTDYRQTSLKTGELIVEVQIPKPFPAISRFYKVSKRVHDDISTVAAGFAIDLDEHGNVQRARLAYGGVAATPVRATAAERALVGQPWNAESMAQAKTLADGAFTPMTDQRGTAAYRAKMVGSLLEKFFAETGASA